MINSQPHQSQRIFGLTVKTGNQDQYATTEIIIAITNLHQEEARQERKGEKEVMSDLLFHENYVWKYSVVLADNVKRLCDAVPKAN